MAEPNITELVATTLRNRSRQIADNVSRNNALLSRLQQRGNILPAGGGRNITEPLLYSEITNFQWYRGYETLDTTPNTVVDAAEYEWKQCAANVTWSGLEIRIQNASVEQQIDLLDARMEAAEITMANQVAIGIYSDGTGFGGKQITGLAAAVNTTPTGVYGNIDAATFTFWQNQAVISASVSANPADLETSMRSMWLQCSQGGNSPDLIVAEDILFSNFWSRLQDIQRVTSSNEAVRGFQSLKFVNADVVYDGDTMAAAAVGQKMYFLNTKFLKFRPHTNTNFTALDQRAPVNQDANVVPLVFAGNLTVNHRRVQGVIATA